MYLHLFSSLVLISTDDTAQLIADDCSYVIWDLLRLERKALLCVKNR